MKKIKLGLIVSSILLLLLTPTINRLVNQNRVEKGFGGEVLLWIFPIALLGFVEEPR